MAAARNGTADESGGCELYLVTPVLSDAAAFLPRLGQVLSAFPVAAVRLRLASAPREVLVREIGVLRATIQDCGVALMLDGLPELARETGCDGVHVDGADVPAARRVAGDALQLGAFCGTSRDVAMQAGENGADYISFGPFSETSGEADIGLLQWWTEMMELPVVAEYAGGLQHGTETARLDQLVRMADFLAVGGDGQARDGVWDAPFPLLDAVRSLG